MMRRLAITAALAAAAITAAAGAASARAFPLGPGHSSPVTATATTRITNDPDNGHGTPSNWATDTITRTVTVTKGTQVAAAGCGPGAGACYSYTASLSDSGTFVTKPGAGTPNQSCAGCAGLLIKAPAVSGTIQGTYTVTFDASYPVADASLVARTHDDGGAPAAGVFTSTNWGQQFFPAGTHFGNVVGGAYTWTYQVMTFRFPYFSVQRWADSSSNSDGDSPGAGNITG